MIFNVPKNVSCDYDGYKFFIELYHATVSLFLSELSLNFEETTWFDSSLLAISGALLNRIESNLNSVRIINLNSRIKTLFSRNHFLSHFGGYDLPDYYASTVQYNKFKPSEERYFKSYLDMELLSKDAFPQISPRLRKKINESIFEIFNNAVIHGQCDNIFSCGQLFPKKKILTFCIVDLGKTIKINVQDFLNNEISGQEAIVWATTATNTTRRGPIPGGLGLKLIREFLQKNSGMIQIVSSDGFWQESNNRVVKRSYHEDFSGTVVTLSFNVDDPAHYYLVGEFDPSTIF